MIGTVRTVGKGGQGIISEGEKTVFVPDVLPGEVVEYIPDREQHKVLSATLKRVLDPSPWRQVPPCPHFSTCGGCNFQHIVYEEQLRLKERILRDNLRRIAKIDWTRPLAIEASRPWRYRTRTEFKIAGGKTGFFRRRSHELVEIGSCLLVPPIIEEFLKSGSVRQHISPVPLGRLQALTDGQSVSAHLAGPESESDLDTPAGIVFSLPGTDGRRYEYRSGPKNFIQANLFLLPVMLRLLEEALDGRSATRAVDIFSGAGFFLLPLAAHCGRVLAVENHPENLAALRRNLELNRIANATIADADAYATEIPAADLFVADPPRGGLGRNLVTRMTAKTPRAVIYFSCDSATFARDILFFARSGYVPETISLIDNFPQTDHFEIFSVLKKTTAEPKAVLSLAPVCGIVRT